MKQQRKSKDPRGNVANDDPRDESKAKKYSDRRKEDRQRRDKEKADKKRKEEDIITIDDDSSRDDVLEDLSEAAKSLSLNESGETSGAVKKEKRKSYRERREEKKLQNATDPTEGEDKQDKRDADKDKRDRKYKKPDLQIYRPGMGRFSSKKPQEKKEDEVPGAKSSPEESRDSSPSKKVSTKSSRNTSPEEKKGRANRKPRTEEFHPEEERCGGGTKRGKAEAPIEEKKETLAEPTSEQAAPLPSAPRSKGYRANRVAKSKKKDPEVKAEDAVEKSVTKIEKPEEMQQQKPFDETKIPPLTSAPNVITLDNDKID